MGNSKFNKIPGGLAARSKPSDFDPKQLAMGIEVEKEHGKNARRAREIAMDHLKELPNYYTHLKRMEKGADKAHKESRMEIHQMLGLLEGIRSSLEEAVSVKATGKTHDFLPGVDDPGQKKVRFNRFPQKTVSDTKTRDSKQRAMRDAEVKSTAPAQPAAMQAKKKKGLISRAVSRIKGSTNESMFVETYDIRSLLEVKRLSRLQAMDKKTAADSAYDKAEKGDHSSASDNSDASRKARSSVKASEFAAKFQKGKSHRQYTKLSGDAESMKHKQNALATVRDRLQNGPRG